MVEPSRPPCPSPSGSPSPPAAPAPGEQPPLRPSPGCAGIRRQARASPRLSREHGTAAPPDPAAGRRPYLRRPHIAGPGPALPPPAPPRPPALGSRPPSPPAARGAAGSRGFKEKHRPVGRVILATCGWALPLQQQT
ncbi:uncharacterized protein LOC135315247 [Phalacrocorax carbo]|uniref:uncharacterized protein LOC135315247 n=1 Tax=Phalacrocorax carbo TaxID=9209 RepID=UPI0031199E96